MIILIDLTTQHVIDGTHPTIRRQSGLSLKIYFLSFHNQYYYKIMIQLRQMSLYQI